MQRLRLRDKALEVDFTMGDIDKTVDQVILMLGRKLERKYPDAMLATLFKNQSKCRDLVESLAQNTRLDARWEPFATAHGDNGLSAWK